MAKTYTVEKSDTTGWWVWQCRDGSALGSATSKSDARSQARAACGNAFALVPPAVDAQVVGGSLTRFTINNLDNVRRTFDVSEISENAVFYFYGLECADPTSLTNAEKAMTILKIWGIYRGGQTEEEISALHFLSRDQFQKLIERKYKGLKIVINDDDTIQWAFPPQITKNPR